MPVLRNVDVFVKPRADLRSKSAAGGAITLVASTTAVVLFFAQLYLYMVGSSSHTLHLSESKQFHMLSQDTVDPFQSRAYDIQMKMPLHIHITFLHMDCSDIEVKLNNSPITNRDVDGRSKKANGSRELVLRAKRPNPVELKRIFGSETSPEALRHKGRGCTLNGQLRVPVVAGHVSITLTRQAWTEALNHYMARSQWSELQKAQDVHRNDYNMSHYIHTIRFGKKIPSSVASTSSITPSYHNQQPKGKYKMKNSHRPLENKLHIIENQMGGIALENIQVKLVPTVSRGFFFEEQYYQMSVVDHTIQPETMVNQGVNMQPGLALGYDITPLAVHHNDGRDSFLIFLSSLIGIVGGCFVTMGLLTGCLVHSAKAVAKKVD
ncbi:endoplasmic reticulum vesicle transporter [Nitzschia inconspicua]|uniref:Endoplasmic reticulum vesicle transporter n=1 Tax=Nitzschia inconspicua TaxID=303405 RepID=A0A9K3PQD3_9STRA|nr:endoplasmic reticulum vesicle transporter [Nitzschia inconspicua]